MTTRETATYQLVTQSLFAERPLWGPFIGGRFLDLAAPVTFEVLEPAGADPLARVVAASDEVVDMSGRGAIPSWPPRP